MGYDIKIGEACVVAPAGAGEADEGVPPRIWAVGATHPEAPAPDIGHPHNGIAPSYGGWSGFADAVGLRDLFFDEKTGLMRDHPGAAVLTRKHHARIHAELVDIVDGVNSVGDDHRQRLVWLEWWVRWALDNCTIPVIANT